MYCSNCGAEASGNFCSKCGAPLKEVPHASADITQDWSREVRYEKLIRIPVVRIRTMGSDLTIDIWTSI